MPPETIIHMTVSLDNAFTGFDVDIGLHYELLLALRPDALLFGSTTARTGIETFMDIDRPEGPDDLRCPAVHADDPRPVGVFVDSRGALNGLLHFYRQMEHIKDVAVLVSETTPEGYLAYLREREYPYVVCGTDRVDLRAAPHALEERFGFTRIVSDSGAGLTDALIRAGAADGISLVVTPAIAGEGQRKLFASVGRPVGLELIEATPVRGGRVHLRYAVGSVGNERVT